MATFDGTGLTIDRLADIRSDIQADLRAVFGDGVNLEERSPFGVLVGLVSERYSLIWELLEAVYDASFPNLSFGIYLDELVAFNGIVREAASYSVVELTFTRSNGTNDGDVTVPAGTQVSALSGSSVVWATDNEITILNGFDTGAIQATADLIGEVGALADTLTSLLQTVPNVASVTNLEDATVGSEEETDSELKIRRTNQLGRAGTATESGIVGALSLLDEVRNSALVVNDTDITDGDGRPPHSFEAYVFPETDVNLGQLSNTVFDSDFVTGNSSEIQINSMVIAGSPVVFNTSNAQTLADIAAAIEAEADVASALSDAADTIDYQGATSVDLTISVVTTGGATQPVGTFSEIAPAGDTLDVIAQSLWDSKAAGIQTYGTFTGEAIDSSGDSQLMSFSDIDEIRLWVKYTLTVDGDYDAGSAEAAMAAAVAAYAENNLFAGVDVLNYKLLCAASDVGSAGILDIVCENSLDGISFAATNRTIEVFEFASINSGDVSFEYV